MFSCGGASTSRLQARNATPDTPAAGGSVNAGDSDRSAGEVEMNGQDGGFGDGDGGGGESLMGGGGGDHVSPTVIQSLFDYTQTGIAPWGPVIQTHNVNINGQVIPVKQLGHYDPFTAMYQLPNGDLVMTNEPFAAFVLTTASTPPPPAPATEVWQSPNGPMSVFSNQILVQFDAATTQQQVEQIIAARSLHVIFSDFDPNPDEPGASNANAYFRFEYPSSWFGDFQSAYAYFSGLSGVIEVGPNEVKGYECQYTQGQPSDYWYGQNQTRHIQALGINNSTLINMGPPYGGALSQVCVAVIDSGVQRGHPDFIVNPNNPLGQRKVSWAGVTCMDRVYFAGRNWGDTTHVNLYPPDAGRLQTHGTKCAGTITAKTFDTAHPSDPNGNNGGIFTGVASCAPECGVFPIALNISPGTDRSFTNASTAESLVFLKEAFKQGHWTEDIRVVSMSFARFPGYIGFEQKMINRDLKDSDRLYIASAGNLWAGDPQIDGDDVVYPAGYDNVMGVSGLWVHYNPQNQTTQWFSRDTSDSGSNYKLDAALNPLLREYPVSAIFGSVDSNENWVLQTRVTSTQLGNSDNNNTMYESFSGTSFAAPQVAALAALLYDAHPERNRFQVRDRIITTRDTVIQASTELLQYQLAGPVRFSVALGAGW